ncbi:MAG TPA: hypothetical protein VFN13_08240 [Rudaea sp.]|nr:hypothetical protein [Rudaea sp.]
MNLHTFQLLERLNTKLYRLSCEVQFTSSLIDPGSRCTLEVDSEDLSMVMDRLAHQLRTAHGIAQQLFRAEKKR